MKWQKRGLVYVPTGEQWWAKSHAFIPTAEVLEDRIRVYFTSLDVNKFGRIGYVEVDIEKPSKILFLTNEPVLDIGILGTFDDCGVNASCVVNVKDKKYLYYIGWQRVERVPYMLFSGLAISLDGGKSFERYSNAPVLDRTPSESFSRSAPFVFIDRGLFKTWYWSCTNWSVENGWVHYNNVIKYAESTDGINWKSTNDICIAPDGKEDYSVGRPWVIKDGGIHKMWYSIRSKTKPYSMGYAESMDGLNWVRKDNEVGIDTSEAGWDSGMICFPCVVDAKGKRYMFYNGNRHGETGFGYAVLES
jgi:predicted GH43/DUF377 family glycosyl hydrolase